MPCSTSNKINLKQALIEKSKECGFDIIKITKPKVDQKNKDYFDQFYLNDNSKYRIELFVYL